ncbi:MAG: homoserine kinase [Planctomycetes bacterium]|nr:homoserine kinase [Planctomycetota bacterium]
MPAFRVPASTTNLGHGFDCLGIALGFANTITVTPRPDGEIVAPGAADPGLAAMAVRVRDACVARWSTRSIGFAVTVAGDVPIARGMGSSATILLGVAAACQELMERPRDDAELIEIAAAIEGHPDNVAAACLGGFTVVGTAGGRLRWSRFAVPADLVAVVAIPPFEVKTSEARRILPHQLTRAESVLALQRTALIAAALAAGRAEELRGLFDDAWHERHRAGLNPGLVEARAAAAAAGAIGTILSGSGSTVLSFATRIRAEAVRAAVEASYGNRGGAVTTITAFDNGGCIRM